MKDLSAQSNPLNQQFKHERIPGRVLESGPESSDRENIPKINIYKEIKHSDQMHPEWNKLFVQREHRIPEPTIVNSSHRSQPTIVFRNQNDKNLLPVIYLLLSFKK